MKKPNLGEMLTYCRPAGSLGEIDFIADYIAPVLGMQRDEYGNYFIRIEGEYNKSVMFSCHTDSVHVQSGRQTIALDTVRNEYFVPAHSKSNCLGADCATGVYIMLRLIEMNVPGLYVFHRDEECGGFGSIHFARHGDLTGITQCIAFDRKGTGSIITHQGGRTASDAYALALGDALEFFSNGELSYGPDDTGTFTDSANYTHIIQECTNLSVGYARQHSTSETQIADFPDKLIEAIVQIDFDQMPIKRHLDDNEYPERFTKQMCQVYGKKSEAAAKYKPMSLAALIKACQEVPEAAASLLFELQTSQIDLDEALTEYYREIQFEQANDSDWENVEDYTEDAYYKAHMQDI